MHHFHRLTIADIRRETEDAVSIALTVPPDAQAAFAFVPGQHLTLRATIDGAEVRRSYSICSGFDDGELRVAIKRIPGGAFSNYACDRLMVGDAVEAMPPAGGFGHAIDPADAGTYVCFAAGSGITPILSIVKSLLSRAPRTKVILFYGNARIDSIIFHEDLEDLKNRYLDRFSLLHLLSREPQDIPLLDGRIGAATVSATTGRLFDPATVAGFYLCGPAGMIEAVTVALSAIGAPVDRIHHELFLAPAAGAAAAVISPSGPAQAEVVVIRDGITRRFTYGAGDSKPLLDAAIDAGIDLPFACKTGVCSTCRCKSAPGSVEMIANYALEPWELEAGYALACQGRPLTAAVTLDFDAV